MHPPIPDRLPRLTAHGEELGLGNGRSGVEDQDASFGALGGDESRHRRGII